MDAKIERKKFNVILLGETSVGKTCLVKSLTGQPFDEHQIATIGIDNVIRNAIIKGKKYGFKICI